MRQIDCYWRVLITAAFAVMVGVGAASAARGDGSSPQWRGPNRDGHSDGAELAGAWNAGGPPLLWSSRVGLGYSSVAVHDGVVYTTGHLGSGVYIVALNKANGCLRWKARICPKGKGRGYAGARSTPTFGHDGVYAIGGLGDVIKSTSRETRSGAVTSSWWALATNLTTKTDAARDRGRGQGQGPRIVVQEFGAVDGDRPDP